MNDDPGASPTFPFSVPGPPSGVSAPRLPLHAGRRLGDYRLEALLGRGASASVWRATDLRLQMPVALKLFVPRGKAGRALLDGVMREARAASRVVSDFVIRVKDAGYFPEDDLGFIAMELCAAFPDPAEVEPGEQPTLQVGRTLEQKLPDSTEDAVRIIAQAARGVADAHREGIFHRDIKPANILVRPGSKRAQITDFGLTVAELGGEGSVRVELPGEEKRIILGTPEYMPPEAAAGLPMTLDPVKDHILLTGLDVYGLGATLYALLAGKPPYRPRPGAENGALDLIEQVREGPPADILDLGSTHLSVDPQLARVLRRAMARDPDQRHVSALALAEDLEAILAGRPTSLDAPHPLLRLKLYLRRNRYPVSATASVVVMLAALVISSLVGHQLREQVEDAQHQVRELDRARQQAFDEAVRWESLAAEATTRADQAMSREEQALEVVASTELSLSATRQYAEQVTMERDQALAEVAALQASNTSLESERDRARSEADAWSRRAISAEAERDAAQDAAASQQARAEAAEMALTDARNDVNRLERLLATEKSRRMAAEEQAAEIVRDLRDAERDRDAWQAEVAHLQRSLEQSRARVRNLEADLAALRAMPQLTPIAE